MQIHCKYFLFHIVLKGFIHTVNSLCFSLITLTVVVYAIYHLEFGVFLYKIEKSAFKFSCNMTFIDFEQYLHFWSVSRRPYWVRHFNFQFLTLKSKRALHKTSLHQVS